MNIRSMIKHVAAIITAVGMLLASMAGAVTALAEDSKPTTAVDGPTKPVRIMDNLYQTRYTGDYKLDDYLSANAGGNDDYLAWLRANLNHGKPIPLSTTQACTTLAVTDTDTGHDLMVRNMDWYPAVPGMMVATAPTDGYRSVGVAPVMTGKANATPTTDELETSANIAPLTTMDGVNEKGLSAAILQIHRWQAPNDGKPSISQLAVVRLLLDKAATVDEAISLLGRYDIAAYGDKYASLGGLHYALADATGAKATIEFDGGKMHVTRPTDTYQTTTNTMTWNHEIESDRRWKKVDTAVREAGGSMDERDAFGLLAATPSHSTSTLQWTVAYDLDAKTGIITTRGRTDQARTLTLDGIQTAASPVTVRYDANGGRGTITDMTGNPGDQIDIPSTGVTRSGYTLAGWNTQADGRGRAYTAGNGFRLVADPKSNPVNTSVLYAQWRINRVTLKFNPNGGTGGYPDITVDAFTTVTIPADAKEPKVQRPGFRFTGWAMKPTPGAGDTLLSPGKGTVSMPDRGSITVYAQWAPAMTTLPFTGGNAQVPTIWLYAGFALMLIALGVMMPMLRMRMAATKRTGKHMPITGGKHAK